MPRITREPLTRRSVESAKTTGKAYRLRDATVPGLVLRVSATGMKTWAVVWGRGQERAFGDFPAITLDGAREIGKRLSAEIAAHGAPLAVLESRKPAPAAPKTLRAFVESDYRRWARSELKRADEAVARILSVFPSLLDLPLLAIDRKMVEDIISTRRAAGASIATTNRDLATIKAALAKAVEWDMLPTHPLARLKASRVTTGDVIRYLSKAEDKRLREALEAREADRRASRERHNAWHGTRNTEGHPQWPLDGFTDHLMPMVLVAKNTGLRRGELFGLQWASVNLQGKLLTVRANTAKSGKVRHVPLNTEAAAVLKRWHKQHPGTGLVFPNSAGGRFDNIQTSWERLTKAAKLQDFRFHDLRHDFASKLVMAGVDLNTVRELLGHADIKMTLRYAHLAPDKLAEAVARLQIP